MGAHEKDFPFVLGSMPPNSHSIFDEGAVFMSYKLVDGGIFQEEGNFRICRVVVSSVIPSSERCFNADTKLQFSKLGFCDLFAVDNQPCRLDNYCSLERFSVECRK